MRSIYGSRDYEQPVSDLGNRLPLVTSPDFASSYLIILYARTKVSIIQTSTDMLTYFKYNIVASIPDQQIPSLQHGKHRI